MKLNLKTGDLVLRVRDNDKLIGESVMVASQIAINHLIADGDDFNTDHEVRWPLQATASVSTVSGQFESVTPITYTIKNIGSKDVGPKGIQPFGVAFTWASDNIPSSAVTVLLDDGRRFNLANAAELHDITVPAGKTIQVKFNVAVLDANSAKKGDGVFKFGLRMNSLVDGKERTVQNALTTMYMILDLYNLAFDQAYNLSSQGIMCTFKNRGSASVAISGIHYVKDKGGTQVRVELYTSSSDKSAVYKVASHLFFPYLENFEGANKAPITVDLLNKYLAGQSRGSWAFSSCK